MSQIHCFFANVRQDFYHFPAPAKELKDEPTQRVLA